MEMIRISLCGEHKNIRNQMKLPMMGVSFDCYPALTDSKTPTSKFCKNKEVRWEINCP
jgi:hypothetical protein